MSIILYKIVGREVRPTEEKDFERDKIYIIIDKTVKKGKIWIWSGPESKSMDRYFAGVSATKIKSKKRMYGASIEVIEGGKEPEHFPDLSKAEIKEASKEYLELDKVIVPITERNEELSYENIKSPLKPRITPKQDINSETITEIEEKGIIKDPNLSLITHKFESILKDISLDMEKIQNKIKNFLTGILE